MYKYSYRCKKEVKIMRNFKKPSLALVLAVFCIFIAAAGIVSADPTFLSETNYKNINLDVANANHTVRFQDPTIPAGTYNYFNASQTSGGVNAVHITNSTSNLNGNVNNITATNGESSGTFYLSDTGGQGWEDNAILMIAVNGTLESLQNEGFSVSINSSGYQWTPVTSTLDIANVNYVQNAVSETFNTAVFNSSTTGYGPLFWKPCTTQNYPIYEGENVTADNATGNTFSMIFVDTYVGIVGTGTSGYSDLNHKGTAKIDYSISNLPSGSMVAFGVYAFRQNSPWGTGIRWTNSVNNIGNNSLSTSGWYVKN
jgi:hypothetical protein